MLLAKCEVANIGLHCYWLSVSDLTLQSWSRVGSIHAFGLVTNFQIFYWVGF